MSQTSGAAPAKQRLSTPQTLKLMRLEVENAQRYGHAISCLMLALDGYVDSEEMLHRRVLMPALFQELKRIAFEGDLRGLGIWTEGYLIAVFPHVSPERIRGVGDSLLEQARRIPHPEGRERETITVSIGISHNQHQGEDVDFENLVADARSGMGMALASGGDQLSGFRAVETEIDRLQGEIEEQLREIEEIQRSMSASSDDTEAAWSAGLVNQVIGLFQREPNKSEDSLRLEKEVVALLRHELSNYTRTSATEELLQSKGHISNLERRISKLTTSLQRTEEELKRIAAMKDIDVGVASLYRTVQGLSADDDSGEAKRDMLKNIFEANLALQAALSSKE